MTLSDPQIRRYARQILLREVGGRGQERLLETPVHVVGDGPALSVAVTYLAAGGSALDAAGPLGGFLEGTTLAAFSPDARPDRPAALVLAAAPARPDGALPRVVVGANGAAFGAAAACPACFERAAAALLPDAEAGPGSVTAGALAALLVQRLALGLKGAPTGLVLLRGADLVPSAPACPAH